MTARQPYYRDDQVTLLLGDAIEQMRTLPDGSVDCIVTSPPYYKLRDYGTPGQYGMEATPAAYVETMRAVFAEARRVLADEGTLWLNIGDKRDQGRLLLMPARVSLALQDDGWIVCNDGIWSKTNPMPEPAPRRLSSRHEYLFLLAKSHRYTVDLDAIREPTTGGAHARSKDANARWIEKARRANGGMSGSASQTLGALTDTKSAAMCGRCRRPATRARISR